MISSDKKEPVDEKPVEPYTQENLETEFDKSFPLERRLQNKSLYTDMLDNKGIQSIYNMLFSLGNYNEDMKSAIKYYCGFSGYEKMNSLLAKENGNDIEYNPSDEEHSYVLKMIDKLDNAFKLGAPRASNPIVVFRGATKPYEHLNNPGDRQKIPTYISTTRDITVALEFSNVLDRYLDDKDSCCLYIIIIPSGMPYIDIIASRAGLTQPEMELLLPCDLTLVYQGDVLIDTKKVDFITNRQASIANSERNNGYNVMEKYEQLKKGEISKEQFAAFANQDTATRVSPGMTFKDSYVCDVANSIRELQKEALNLAVINQLYLDKLPNEIKETLASSLFKTVNNMSSSPESAKGMYKIKVLSVHSAQVINIHGIKNVIKGGNMRSRKYRKTSKKRTKKNKKY
jgi:hypothetical protein